MTRAGSGLSLLADPFAAGQEAVAMAVARCGATPDTVLVFASFHHSARLGEVIAAARAGAGTAQVLGCSAYGVLTEAHEIEEAPAVAALAIAGPGLRITAAQAGPDRAAGRELGAWLGRALVQPEALTPRGLILLPGPEAGWPEDVMPGLAAGTLADVPIFGAGISGPWDAPATARGGEVLADASLALLLAGDMRLVYGCSQAMGPVGKVHRVTGARGDHIAGLSGRPAREVLEEEVGAAACTAVAEGRGAVYVGVSVDPTAERLRRNHYKVSPLHGIDPRDGALIGPAIAVEGTAIGFVMRDHEAARADFAAMLDRLAPAESEPPPAFGLYFNCAARGRDLYEAEDVDVTMIRDRFPGLPVAGLFGSFELCPVDGANRMHAYTGVLVLVS